MSKRKFKGKLSKKREARRLGPLVPENRHREIWNTWVEEDWEKILLLCEEFGVRKDEHMAWNLALALACEYVPGFKEKKRPGPQRKWTEIREAYLVVELERLAEAETCSVQDAADALAKAEPWASFIATKEKGQLAETTPDPGEALRQVYFRARDSRWSKVAKKAYLYTIDMGTPSDWGKMLRSEFQD